MHNLWYTFQRCRLAGHQDERRQPLQSVRTHALRLLQGQPGAHRDDEGNGQWTEGVCHSVRAFLVEGQISSSNNVRNSCHWVQYCVWSIVQVIEALMNLTPDYWNKLLNAYAEISLYPTINVDSSRLQTPAGGRERGTLPLVKE